MSETAKNPAIVYTCLPVRREWKQLLGPLTYSYCCFGFTRAFPFGGNGNKSRSVGTSQDCRRFTRAFPFGGNGNTFLWEESHQFQVRLHVPSRSEGMETNSCLRFIGWRMVYTCLPVRREWKLFCHHIFIRYSVSLHVPSRSEGMETRFGDGNTQLLPMFTRAFPFGGNGNTSPPSLV